MNLYFKYLQLWNPHFGDEYLQWYRAPNESGLRSSLQIGQPVPYLLVLVLGLL